MSTRATYRIYDNYNHLDVYFYIHHDNYPSGAAWYFQEMLDYMKKEGYTNPTAEAFFRANKNAHFTKSHAAHGDTEYHYNICKPNGNGYILQAFEIDNNFKRTFKKFFEGSVEDFIKTYGENQSL